MIFEWTDANIAKLRELWDAGMSGQQMANVLGTSKNSVISKVHRMGWDARPSPIIRDGRVPKDKPKLVARAVRQQAVRLPTLPSIGTLSVIELSEKRAAQLDRKGISAQVVAVEEALVFQPIKPRPCCWPMWGAGRPTHSYCEVPSRPGKPYCPQHHAVAYTTLRQADAGDLAPWVRRDQGLQVVA